MKLLFYFCVFLKVCEIIIFPLIKKLGDQLEALLNKSVTNQEKLSAEKVKQELIVYLNKSLFLK